MNDRFKFRGITKGKVNEFVYGSLLWYAGEPQIWDKDGKNYIVKPETIQQCTGLKDKNCKLIYEGDFLKDDKNLLYEVTFKLQEYETSFSLKRMEIPDYYPHITTWCGLGYRNCNKYEVVGNIYENKELLEDTECQK